jgi:hypothetical protein
MACRFPTGRNLLSKLVEISNSELRTCRSGIEIFGVRYFDGLASPLRAKFPTVGEEPLI